MEPGRGTVAEKTNGQSCLLRSNRLVGRKHYSKGNKLPDKHQKEGVDQVMRPMTLLGDSKDPKRL